LISVGYLILFPAQNESTAVITIGGDTPGTEKESSQTKFKGTNIYCRSENFPTHKYPQFSQIFLLHNVNIAKCSLFFQNIQKLRTSLNLNEIRNTKCKTLLHLIRVPYIVSTTWLYAIRLTKYRGETSVSTLQIFYYCFLHPGLSPKLGSR
jgi:hypothetical protein